MLKQLKYFISVVRNNSFSAAAEENFISQSAISQQIKALERDLGFDLIERGNRSFRLTPVGEYFYRSGQLLLADYERICREASKIANGDQLSLKVGYLRSYAGGEFHRAVALFSEKNPDVALTIEYGNHEELYEMLRTEKADLVLNDQRRAFSDEYVNLILTTSSSYVEVSSNSPLAGLSGITPDELRNFPCILISSPSQKETEQEYYQNIVGIRSDFLLAENLEEARLMVIGRRGYLPVEGGPIIMTAGTSIVRIPLLRGGEPIRRNYCAFWKKDNSGYYVEEFASILADQFKD